VLEITEITEAINELIAKAYPNDPVYVNLIPKDFSRPSTLIAFVNTERTDASRKMLAVKIQYALTCFCEVDGHYNSDTQAVTERQDGIMRIFARGYIKVADRSVKLVAASSGAEITESYIDLNIEYFDERPDEGDCYPIAESVDTIITNGG